MTGEVWIWSFNSHLISKMMCKMCAAIYKQNNKTKRETIRRTNSQRWKNEYLSSRLVCRVSEYVMLSAVSLCFRNRRNSFESSCESPSSYACDTKTPSKSFTLFSYTFVIIIQCMKYSHLKICLKDVTGWCVWGQIFSFFLNPLDHSLSHPVTIR